MTQVKNNNLHAKGTTWCKGIRRWKAQFKRKGVVNYLGVYKTQEEAHRAYLEAVIQKQEDKKEGE